MRLFGTAYLDLQCHPDYLSLIEGNLRAYGINNPLSRSNPGQFKPLEAVERFLTEDLKTEDAVLLPNGFSSGQCLHEIAQQKVAEGQGLLVSKEGHLCYRHPRKEHTREKPAGQEGENGYGVLLDAVDPFTGHCDWLHSTDTKERLAKAAWVAIDLSHSYGVWESEVFLKVWPVRASRSLYFGSLGKASAFPAGFVAGPSDFIQAVRALPVYTAAAPPANALAASFLAATELRAKQRAHLHEIIHRVRHELNLPPQPLPFPTLFCGPQSAEVYEHFLDQEMEVAYLSYPTAKDPRLLRIVLHAGLDNSQLTAIIKAYKSLALPTLPFRPAEWTTF